MGVPVQPALIINISAMLLAQNKRPHMPASPVLYGMVESGRYWQQKKFLPRLEVST
jgi:hypothetical protein